MSNDVIWESNERHPYLEYRKVYEVFGEAPVAYYRVKGTEKEYRATIDMMRSFKCITDDETSLFIEVMQFEHGCIEDDIKQWKKSHLTSGVADTHTSLSTNGSDCECS
jgi:hypothetical protein